MFLYKFISINYVKQALGIYDVYGSEDLWNSESGSVVSDSLRPHGLYSPWNSPGQNTGVSSRSLLQGILSTQGSNPGLPHCKRILYQLSHKGSQKIHYLTHTSNSLFCTMYKYSLILSCAIHDVKLYGKKNYDNHGF